MRKLILAGIFAALALGLAPAQAADPYCATAGGAFGDDGDVGWSCTFEADDNPHGYVAATPNDFRVFLDVDGDGQLEALDGDTIVIEVAPTEGDPLAGELDLTTGSSYTVELINGCAGPGCGNIGGLAVK